ncbi:MAG: hypothetical protein K0R28_6616 [Paenibacillus sp.]|nr:hypothetical protein [Paenibacillus sp.]
MLARLRKLMETIRGMAEDMKDLEAIKLKGIEEGMEEGIEQGTMLGKESVAINLIGMGLSDSAIVLAIGLSEQKIEQLRKQVH